MYIIIQVHTCACVSVHALYVVHTHTLLYVNVMCTYVHIVMSIALLLRTMTACKAITITVTLKTLESSVLHVHDVYYPHSL